MGLRGPAPTPTPILSARGSRLAAGREGEVQFPAGRPTCPAWLSKPAKAEWRRVVGELEAAGVLAEVDRATLSLYCEAWGEVVELSEAIAGLGGPGEAWRLVKLKNAAAERVARYAQQFGFTPSSRSRVKAPAKPEAPAGGKARYFA